MVFFGLFTVLPFLFEIGRLLGADPQKAWPWIAGAIGLVGAICLVWYLLVLLQRRENAIRAWVSEEGLWLADKKRKFSVSWDDFISLRLWPRGHQATVLGKDTTFKAPMRRNSQERLREAVSMFGPADGVVVTKGKTAMESKLSEQSANLVLALELLPAIQTKREYVHDPRGPLSDLEDLAFSRKKIRTIFIEDATLFVNGKAITTMEMESERGTAFLSTGSERYLICPRDWANMDWLANHAADPNPGALSA